MGMRMLAHVHGDGPAWHFLIFLVTESLFGMAPFASETFDELEEKVLDSTPIEVSCHYHYMPC